MKCVGIYPNPYSNDKWSSQANPILLEWAKAIEENGWTVIGLDLENILNLNDLNANIQVLHIHWTDDISAYFCRIFGYDIPAFISKKRHIFKLLEKPVEYLVKFRINKWIKSVSKSEIIVVFQIHDLASHSYIEFPLLQKCDNYLKKTLYDLSNGIATQEHSALREVFSFFGEKKYYAITFLGDYSKFHGPMISNSAARGRLNISNKGKIISYIGNVRPNRNPTEVINTFLKANVKDNLLILAGPGMEKYVGKIESKKILIFDGFIDNEKIRDIFCCSDFIINDAKNYLTSAIVRTSISYHIPVIIRPFGAGIDMANGAMLEIQDDARGLENAILTALLMTDTCYLNLKKNAALRSEERTWSLSGRQFVSLYEKLISAL